MRIFKRLGKLVGLPPTYFPNPPGAFTITAGDMYTEVEEKNNLWHWRHHRLVQAGMARMEPILPDYEYWPVILSIKYLEEGEGGEPTVYLTAAEGPELQETFPLHPADFVVVLPPKGTP